MTFIKKKCLLVLCFLLLAPVRFASADVTTSPSVTTLSEASLEEQISLNPNSESAYRKLATLYKKTGETQKLEALQEVVESKFTAPYWAYSYVPPKNLSILARRAWLQATEDRLLRQVVANPTEADFYLFLGNINRFQDDPTEALKWYDKALEIAPNYKDLRASRASVLNTLNRPNEALEMVALDLPTTTDGYALQATENGTLAGGAASIVGKDGKKPSPEQLKALLRSRSKLGQQKEFQDVLLFAQEIYPDYEWENDFSQDKPKYDQTLRAWHGNDYLSNDLATWDEEGVGYSIRTPDKKNTFRAGMTRTERFNNTDLSYQAGYTRKVTDKLNTGIDISFGPGNRIVPVFLITPSVTYKLPWNFTTQHTYRLARYSEQTTQAGIHTLQYSIKPLNAAVGYTIRHSHIENVSKVPISHSVYVSKYYRNNSFVTLSGNMGQAAEYIASVNPARVLNYDRNGVSLTGTHFLTDKSPWGITWGLNYTHYDGLFDSFGYKIGVQRNF